MMDIERFNENAMKSIVELSSERFRAMVLDVVAKYGRKNVFVDYTIFHQMIDDFDDHGTVYQLYRALSNDEIIDNIFTDELRLLHFKSALKAIDICMSESDDVSVNNAVKCLTYIKQL